MFELSCMHLLCFLAIVLLLWEPRPPLGSTDGRETVSDGHYISL